MAGNASLFSEVPPSQIVNTDVGVVDALGLAERKAGLWSHSGSQPSRSGLHVSERPRCFGRRTKREGASQRTGSCHDDGPLLPRHADRAGTDGSRTGRRLLGGCRSGDSQLRPVRRWCCNHRPAGHPRYRSDLFAPEKRRRNAASRAPQTVNKAGPGYWTATRSARRIAAGAWSWQRAGRLDHSQLQHRGQVISHRPMLRELPVLNTEPVTLSSNELPPRRRHHAPDRTEVGASRRHS